MNVLILSFSIIFTFFFPILSIPINFIGILLSRGKIRKLYAFLLAIALATVAYIWVPNATMDLHLHHYQVGLLADGNVDKLGAYIGSSFEPAQYLLKYFVAQVGNFNLLQFIVILFGYFEVFWVICDYAEHKKLKTMLFGLLFLYVFSSVRFIDFASGLWFNFAIANIALGTYLLFFKEKKYLPYGLFALAVSLHIATLFAVVIIILIRKLNVFKRIKISTIIISIIVAASPAIFVAFLNNVFGVSSGFVNMVNNMYDSYFTNGAQFDALHTGWNLVLSLANITFCLLVGLSAYKNKLLSQYSSFVIYLIIFIIVAIAGAGVFVRYTFLVAILSFPLISEVLQWIKNKKSYICVLLVVLALVILQFSRFFLQMEAVGVLHQINIHLFEGLPYLLGVL